MLVVARCYLVLSHLDDVLYEGLQTIFRNVASSRDTVIGADNSVFVSGSMCAADLVDGEYDSGGRTVYARDGKALPADGAIVAFMSNVYEELKNVMRFGVPVKQTIKSATIDPACASVWITKQVLSRRASSPTCSWLMKIWILCRSSFAERSRWTIADRHLPKGRFPFEML